MDTILTSGPRSLTTAPRRGLAICWALGLFGGAITLMALNLPAGGQLWPALPVIGALLILLDAFAVRDLAGQPLSLAGVVLIATGLSAKHGLPSALLLAVLSGLLIKPPRLRTGWVEIVTRRLAESGARGLALAATLSVGGFSSELLRLAFVILGYVLIVQTARLVLAILWIGLGQALERVRELLPSILLIEALPLPLAILGAAIATAFEWPLIGLAMGGLLGSAVLLRRGSRSLGQQRRAVAELGQINSISRAIIRAELDVDALCDLIYTEASKVVDTSNFRLGLFDNKQFELKVRVQDNQREPPLTVTLEEDQGLVGWMRRTGRSLLVEDFNVEMDRLPAQPTYQAEQPPRSGVYIPLLAGDTVLGTISIQSREPEAFDADDLRLLSLIADQAAIAIAKARAYDAARRRAAQLAAISEVSRQVTAILDLDRLLPSVVRRIRASFGYYQVHLFTVDPQTHELVFRASTNPNSPFWQKQGQRLPPGVGIVGYVAETGEPMLVNDVDNEPHFLADGGETKSELTVPLRIGSHLIGVLDVQSDRRDAFDENDFFVLQTLADQTAIAIDSANTFTAQQEEAWVLNALLQSAENIARTKDLSDLLMLAVRLPALLVGCDHAACILWNRDTHMWTMVAAWGFNEEQRSQLLFQPIPPDTVPLVESIRASGTIGTVTDLARAAVLLPSSTCIQGSVLAMPLTARAMTMGVLLLDKCDPEHPWKSRQLTVASGIAGQAAAAIEGALLARDEAERQRLEQEIGVAREIQTSLLPAQAPQVAGWDMAAVWESARQVGGDFYDFWEFGPDNEYGDQGFVIADVSDKGVPAALFMALSRSLVRAAALDGSSPSIAMMRANRWIVRDSQSCMFVTLFYGVLEHSTGELCYSCAGHNPPLLYRAASHTVEAISTPGIALGVIDEAILGEARTTLHPGDVLVCYTDGVTEAINSAMEEWGVPQLTATILQSAHLAASAIVATILANVETHAGDLPPFDDVTLVVIKRASHGHG